MSGVKVAKPNQTEVNLKPAGLPRIKEEKEQRQKLTFKAQFHSALLNAVFSRTQARCWDCVRLSSLCFAQSDRLLAASCM